MSAISLLESRVLSLERAILRLRRVDEDTATRVTNVEQGGASGVTGPGSSGVGNLASFNSASGDVLQDSGVPAASVVTDSSTSTLTSKTINTSSNTLVVDAADVQSGVLPIVRGGTGAMTSQAALDAIAPGTMAGDLLVYDGNLGCHCRLPVGSNGTVLRANNALDQGVEWGSAGGTGDVIGPASSVANQIPVFADGTGKVVSDSGVNVATVLTTGSTLSVDASTEVTTGTLSVARGGTGQVTLQAALDALASFSSKGQLLVYDGTNVGRLTAGSDGEVLTAASGAPLGLVWNAPATGGAKPGVARRGTPANLTTTIANIVIASPDISKDGADWVVDNALGTYTYSGADAVWRVTVTAGYDSSIGTEISLAIRIGGVTQANNIFFVDAAFNRNTYTATAILDLTNGDVVSVAGNVSSGTATPPGGATDTTIVIEEVV